MNGKHKNIMIDEFSTLPQLTRRQEDILALIVGSYTQVPEPVSSKQIVEEYKLIVSSATVRNEMARLEELGYITAPHTSAGRIPTAMGYRYFVRGLMYNKDLELIDREQINNKFGELPAVLDSWMKQAATILARTVRLAALVTPPSAEQTRFKHIELIAIQGRLVLMVLVLHGGAVHQRMLNLADSVSQRALSETAEHLNAICADLSANQMRVKRHSFELLERDIIDLATDIMDRAGGSELRYLYRDGLSEIISSFPDTEGAQQAVRVFEERAFLEMIMSEALRPVVKDEENDVRVIIAGDNRWEEMSQLSMVLGHYGVPGQLSGALGLLGPTNINYGRAIGAVRHVSALMTDMLVTMYNETPNSSSLPDEATQEEDEDESKDIPPSKH